MIPEVMNLSPVTLPLVRNKYNKIQLDKKNLIRGHPKLFKGYTTIE